LYSKRNIANPQMINNLHPKINMSKLNILNWWKIY
jgi:hypothetical protein